MHTHSFVFFWDIETYYDEKSEDLIAYCICCVGLDYRKIYDTNFEDYNNNILNDFVSNTFWGVDCV